MNISYAKSIGDDQQTGREIRYIFPAF